MFNIKNSNTEFPLFFGEELGLSDAFNVAYPEILIADKKQRELFWDADEIDFSQDTMDLLDADDTVRELLTRALSFQLAGDSIANGSIQMLFLPIITNPQAKGLVSYWGDTESVHDRAYSLIVAQCYRDPNELLLRIREDEILLRRLGPVLRNFKEHMDMVGKLMCGETIPLSVKRKTVIRTIITLLALEGIMFLTSFATTFAIIKATDKFSGIKKSVGLIHDDESISHVRNNLLFLDIIINKEQWPEWNEMKGDAKTILDSVVKSEEEWTEDLFRGCDSIVGFNPKLLRQYSKYLSKPLYDRIGIQWDHEIVLDNPIPWITDYTKADQVQVAAQEAQMTNYKVSSTVDDTSNTDFDFDFDL